MDQKALKARFVMECCSAEENAEIWHRDSVGLPVKVIDLEWDEENRRIILVSDSYNGT